MKEHKVGIIMNGVTGRMGTEPAPDPFDRRHHKQGGVRTATARSSCPTRSSSAATSDKLKDLAAHHG